jgi:hypothetical protein
MTLAEARTALATIEGILNGTSDNLRSVSFGDRTVSYQDKSNAELQTIADRLRRDIARADGKPSRTVSRHNTSWTPS